MYNTYPDDFFLLVRQIRLRKINDSLLAIAIASNPHTEEPKKLIEDLMEQQRFMQGEDPNPEIDRAGLDSLKNQLSKSKMVKVRQV